MKYSSVIVQRLSLMSGNVAVGFFYCNSQQHGIQTPQHIVGTLIKQFASLKVSDGMLPRFLEEYYDTNVGLGRPQLVGLASLLSLTCRSFSKSFMIIDGFYELDGGVQRIMITESKRFFKRNSTRLLISSRPHSPQLASFLRSAFSLKITAQDADLRKVVKSRMKRDSMLQMITGGDSNLADSVAEKVANRSQGQ